MLAPLECYGGRVYIRDMRRSAVSRSVGVLATALVALQLALTASGMPCLMPGARMPTASMRTDGAPMGKSAAVGDASSERMVAGTGSMPDRAPCDQQMRWPVCQAMGPCVTALVPTDLGARTLRPNLPACIAALVVIAPPTLTYPPDLPPPRA